MTALRRLLRAITPADFGTAADLITGGKVHAGVTVTQREALRVVSVYAAVNLIADNIAQLPAHAFRRRDDQRELVSSQPQWLDRVNSQPNPDTDGYTFIHRILNSLLIDGNAYILITARDRLAYPSELYTLHPQEIVPERRNRRLVYVWAGSETFTRYNRLTNPAGDIVHIRAFDAGGERGLSPIDVARQAVGLAIVAEKFGAKFFGAGQHLSGVIEAPKALDKPGADALNQWWQDLKGGSDKAFQPGVLTGGATWKPIAIPPENAQFLETRKFQVNEIARLYRVPPHMIADVEKSTSWGTGIEQQSIGFLTYTLLPWITRLEATFNQLLPRGQFVKWNTAALLRGAVLDRYRAYAIARQNGWLSANEIRRLEDMNPVDGLDDYWQPTNVVDQVAQPSGARSGTDMWDDLEAMYQQLTERAHAA